MRDLWGRTARAGTVITRFEGHIAKYMGDGVLVS
jgi:hypothetical protein